MADEKKRSYHHGDLRTALLHEGLRLLEERHGDDVGLREVARGVGVSATAVYRHFPDKAALLRALAAEGLERLAAAQQEGFDQAGGGKAGFAATGRAYVSFALANPALFRLMFANPPEGLGPAERTTVPEAFRMLRENVRFVMPDGASVEAIELAALEAWAKVHGLAVLMLDGQIGRDAKVVNALLATEGT